MSAIKICALGGLGENGKNMYLVEVDEKIFILDAGIKYPSVELFGVDKVIPDMSYIIDNKDRVEGIFLSHGHEDHIGAMAELLKKINVSVYGTRFTMELLEDSLKEAKLNLKNYKLYKINPFKAMTFGDVKVSFFNTTHSVPESIGIAIHTNDGVIVYAPDYTFNQNVGKKYKTSFDEIAKLEKSGVLCLMGESLAAENISNPQGEYKLDSLLNKTFSKAKSRIIVPIFSTDLLRIQKVIDISMRHNKKIAIMGIKTQKIVENALKLGYLNMNPDMFVNLKFITEEVNNEMDDLVILVTGTRHEPFNMIQKMINKKDKIVHLNSNDTVVFMMLPVPGTEGAASKIKDLIVRANIDLIDIKKDYLPSAHASKEDIKLMVNLLKPKFVMPVIGEFRHQYAHKNLLLEMGYKTSNIIMLENGEKITLSNSVLLNKIEKVPTADLLVDGSVIQDINKVVLKDRELLSQDGVFLVIANINLKNRKILTQPEISTKGFVYMKNNLDLIKEVKELFNKTLTRLLNNTEKKLDFNNIRQELREVISKFLYSQTKRRPIVIPVLVEIK